MFGGGRSEQLMGFFLGLFLFVVVLGVIDAGLPWSPRSGGK
jgi:hypothetical protein